MDLKTIITIALGGFITLLVTGFLYDRYLTKKKEKEELIGEREEDCFDFMLSSGNGAKTLTDWQTEDTPIECSNTRDAFTHRDD